MWRKAAPRTALLGCERRAPRRAPRADPWTRAQNSPAGGEVFDFPARVVYHVAVPSDAAKSGGRPREAAHARLAFFIAAGLVIAVAAVYGQVWDHGFVRFDDHEAITGNAGLRLGLSQRGLRWAFETLLVANWIPLTVVSLLADQQLHGLAPRFVLIENVALHALATVLLFHAFRRMTGAVWRSAAVAAVFALHPLHVESVAWAAMRKDSLSGVFFVLALIAHVRFVERPSSARQAAVALCCAAGLLSKPTLVTLPFVLLLVDFWPLGRLSRPDGTFDAAALRRAATEKWPLFVLAALASAVSVRAQSAAGATVGVASLPLSYRMTNALTAYLDYLRTSLWPTGLAVFYPPPAGMPPLGLAIAGFAALAIGSALAWRERRARPWILVGWLWFVGMLVPVIGLVQVGSQARADRYTYLPLIGLSILPVWAAGELAARRTRLRPLVAGAGAAALLALALVSARQVGFWRDGAVLLGRALAVTRDNPLVRANLAAALEEQGRLAEAAEQLRAALRLDPRLVPAMNNLAWMLVTNPSLPEATPDEALRLATRAVEESGGMNPHPLYTVSIALARRGRFAEATQAASRGATVARALGNEPLAREIDARAARYRQGRID